VCARSVDQVAVMLGSNMSFLRVMRFLDKYFVFFSIPLGVALYYGYHYLRLFMERRRR
jgi:hypothetical protein